VALSEDAKPARRVLVIDNEPQVLHVLQRTLTSHGYHVQTAMAGQAGLSSALACPPDLVVTDIALPDMSGFDIIRSLRRWSQVPIIVLSDNSASDMKIAALDAGADDYVAKPFDAAELTARIRAAVRRAGRVSNAARTHVGSWAIDLAGRAVTGPAGSVRLTPSEWRLLEILVRRSGKVVGQDELLAEVSARRHGPDSSYLRVHMMHLRRKLERDPARPRHLLTEPGLGYRFRP
jgi:two-component system KDP operon response regulator KdpE